MGFGLTGFQDWEDYGVLPYCREVCMLVGEIEEGSEIADAQRSKVFELVDGEVVGAWCSGVFAESDGGVHLRRGEWSVVMVEGCSACEPGV